MALREQGEKSLVRLLGGTHPGSGNNQQGMMEGIILIIHESLSI
jgi:hypothetical protein